MSEISNETLRRLLAKEAAKVERYEALFREVYDIFCDLGLMEDRDD